MRWVMFAKSYMGNISSNETPPDSGCTCPCLATSTQMLLDFAILGLVYHLCFLETWPVLCLGSDLTREWLERILGVSWFQIPAATLSCQLLALWPFWTWCNIDFLQQWSMACWSWSWCHVPEQQPALSADNRWFRWSHLINPFTSVIWCCQPFCSE